MNQFKRKLQQLIGIIGVTYSLLCIILISNFLSKIFAAIVLIGSIYIVLRSFEIIGKKINSFLLVIIIILPIIGIHYFDKNDIASGSGNYLYTSNVSVLNVRAGKSANHNILFKVNEGDTLKLIHKEAKWSQISYIADTGYVSSKYISPLEDVDETKTNLATWIIIGGFILLGLFFTSKSSKSNSSHTPAKQPKKASKQNTKAIVTVADDIITDVRINSGYKIEVFNGQGKVIGSKSLNKTFNEELKGFTSTFFVTVTKKDNVVTTFDSNAKEIKRIRMKLNESFRNCSGNTFITYDEKFKTMFTYDKNCKQVNSQVVSKTYKM